MILESQVRALDKAIQALDKQIASAKASRVDDAFRKAWRGFTVRWQLQRDEWIEPGSTARKSIFSESRYEQFKAAFLKWQADFQSRIRGAAPAPPLATPAKPHESGSIFGNLFAGTGTALVVAALVVGGFLYINQRR